MNDIREDLKAYVDGELSEARAAEVEAAIAADPELAQEAEFMKMLGFEIRRTAVEPEVAGRAIAIEKVRNPRGFRMMKWSSWPFAMQAAAAIVLVSMVGTVTFPVFSTKGANETALASRAPASVAAGETAKNESADGMAPSTFEGIIGGSEGAEGRGGGGGFRGGKAGAPSENSRFGMEEQPSRSSQDKEAKSSIDNGLARTGIERAARPGTTVPMKGSNRLVVKNADVSCRVPSVADAMAKAGTVAESLGGFVISSNSSDLKGENPTGMVVMRVPAIRFDSAMKQIRSLGDVINESSSGQDVTAQVADTGARIKVLKAEEESYITMLRAARRVGEMLEIKERLSGVRQEIESLTAQVLSLKDLASLSTITATFEEKTKKREQVDEPKGGFEETWNSAINGLQSVLQFLGSAVIIIFVYSPIWLPVVGVIWWLNKKNKKA